MNSCDLQGVSVLLKLKQSWTLSWPECTSDAVTRIGDLIFYLFIFMYDFINFTILCKMFFGQAAWLAFIVAESQNSFVF